MKAAGALQSVIDLDPDNPEGYYRVGLLNLAENKTATAIEYFQKALERDPYQMEAFTNLVLAYTTKKDVSAALSACDAQLPKVSDNARATAVIHNLKGVLFLEQPKHNRG